MENREHKKGGSYYEMTKWLLEHYLEFCVTEKGFKGFSETAGGRMPMPVVDDDKTFIGILCRRMSETIGEMDENDHKHAKIIYSRYFSGMPEICSMEETIASIGYTNGGYYRLLYRGIELYSTLIWSVLENERKLPFYMYDLKGRIEVLHRMEEGLALHDVGNSCYVDTERILKNYKKIKYLQMTDDLVVIGDNDPLFGKSLYTPASEDNSSYMMLIADSVKRLEAMGEAGKRWLRTVDTVFLDPGVRDKSWRTKMNILGLSPRSYYLQRNRTISFMSKLIWGALGEKHYRSPFFRGNGNEAYGRII